MTRLRRSVLALLLFANSNAGLVAIPAVASSPDASARPASSEEARRGLVVVTIVVDQLAAWIAEARWPLLPSDGGFARLVREGTRVRRMRYAHACTDTAPGHAALYTGATPRVSGIFANEWIDDHGEVVSIVEDASAHVVPPSPTAGSSLRALRVDTIADRLRAERPEATIASFSLKERGALFGGGRRPDATVWYDRSLGRFVTSSTFGASFPDWLPAVATAPLASAPQSWELLDGAFVRANAASTDPEPGEGDVAGLGTTFPHPAPKPEIAASAFRISPRADEVLLEIALAAVDRHLASGHADAPALIAISLSTNDYVGHVFGPDSFEAWDELRRLDGALARFFAALDAKLGPDGWAVLLSADHGVATLPEVSGSTAVRAECSRPEDPSRPRRSCARGARLFADVLRADAEAAAASALGPGEWIRGVADPYVVYTEAARALDPERHARLDAAVVAALSANPLLERVVATASLPKVCPPEKTEAFEGLICESYPPAAPGDVYLVPRAGTFVDTGIAAGHGSSHGTPHDYDRSVPLVVRAPGRVPAGRVLDGPIGFGAFARTASALLDMPPPDAAKAGMDLTSRADPAS
jgi:arylsulfatase A-like enzyme